MQLTYLDPLWWLLGLLVLAGGYFFTLVDRPKRLMIASLGLRALAVIFLVLALCRPGWMRKVDDVHVVFLVDVSQSVDLKAARSAVDEVNAGIAKLERGDSHTVFACGNGVRLRETENLAKELDAWQQGIADDEFRSASRLADAVLTTRLAFPAGKSRRLVLLTDGQETHGSIAAAIDTLKQESVDVVWKKLGGLSDPEASIVSVEPNVSAAFAGEVVRLRVRMAANQEIGGTVRILSQGVKVMEQPVALGPDKENAVEFDVPMTVTGTSLWQAELIPDKDHFPLNNQAAATVEVTGKSRVLVIHKTAKEMRGISRSLQEQEFDVDVRGENGLPDSMDALLAFDAVVLADIPATSISTRQMGLIKSYVQDFGGGLAMLGSENSFGLGGYYKTPIEEVLPLVSRFEKEKEKPSLALVLVIDRSGSMEGLPIQMARQAAKASVELLGPQDQSAVIAFDSEAYLVSDMRRASEKDSIQAAIDTIESAGGTDMYPAMQQAKQLLDNCSAKVKHMICLTDGQTEDRGFAELTQALSDSGVTVSTVALGDGAAADLLQTIAEIGKGRFYAAQDPATVPQIFTRETMQASKSAIKEDVYAPVVLTEHPMLAGYADNLPSCLGYVMTEAKPITQTILAAETGDPLLALGRFGLGQGLCFTSDLTEKWGGEWLAWDGCGKFWAQVLRSILRPKNIQGMEVRSMVVNDEWSFDIRRREPDGSPVNNVKWDAKAVDENSAETPVTIHEAGLGRYTAKVPLAGKAKLTVRLRDVENGKLKVLHYNRPSPSEYRLGQAVPAALAGAPEFSPPTVRENITPVETRRSIEPLCYALALAAALGSILLRRV
jgi:Ca-activated chloride channel family protein